jgi:hypothetical protein
MDIANDCADLDMEDSDGLASASVLQINRVDVKTLCTLCHQVKAGCACQPQLSNRMSGRSTITPPAHKNYDISVEGQTCLTLEVTKGQGCVSAQPRAVGQYAQ